ncbi:MAG: 6,7-dimethyl-8-ribityllumazine synthase, partial [Rhodanobacteraceae bacterium]
MSYRNAEFKKTLCSPSGARYALIASRWNAEIVDALVQGARRAFVEHGVDEN